MDAGNTALEKRYKGVMEFLQQVLARNPSTVNSIHFRTFLTTDADAPAQSETRSSTPAYTIGRENDIDYHAGRT